MFACMTLMPSSIVHPIAMKFWGMVGRIPAKVIPKIKL